jgi:hypothetical protein
MLGLRALRARREQHKALAEERMSGVGDLNLCQLVLQQAIWVIERGIKVFGRLTA